MPRLAKAVDVLTIRQVKQGTETIRFRIGFTLRKLIKTANKTYYHKKFENVKGDVKKTWKLINDLRGKAKTNIKASLFIFLLLLETLIQKFTLLHFQMVKKNRGIDSPHIFRSQEKIM